MRGSTFAAATAVSFLLLSIPVEMQFPVCFPCAETRVLHPQSNQRLASPQFSGCAKRQSGGEPGTPDIVTPNSPVASLEIFPISPDYYCIVAIMSYNKSYGWRPMPLLQQQQTLAILVSD